MKISHSLPRLLASWLIALAIALPAAARQVIPADTAVPQGDSDDIYDIELEQNIQLPNVGRQHDIVQQFMRNQAEKIYHNLETIAGKPLEDKGIKVETMRKDEVVVVTLPTDLLFLPNDSVLIAKADPYLKAFVPYADLPDLYKMVVTVHSDNTGTPAYHTALTEGRVVSLYDWFDRNAQTTDMIIGYPMGATQPINPLNDSRLKRAENRRLEIYLIPNNGMIKLAKDHKLRP